MVGLTVVVSMKVLGCRHECLSEALYIKIPMSVIIKNYLTSGT